MSWIKCKCGNILYDKTDHISYKGHVISDKEYFGIFDLADALIESNDSDRDKLAMSFRINIGCGDCYIKLKDIFQCPACGRILLEDNQGKFCSFFPEDSDDKQLLNYEGNGEIMFAKRRKSEHTGERD